MGKKPEAKFRKGTSLPKELPKRRLVGDQCLNPRKKEHFQVPRSTAHPNNIPASISTQPRCALPPTRDTWEKAQDCRLKWIPQCYLDDWLSLSIPALSSHWSRVVRNSSFSFLPFSHHEQTHPSSISTSTYRDRLAEITLSELSQWSDIIPS